MSGSRISEACAGSDRDLELSGAVSPGSFDQLETGAVPGRAVNHQFGEVFAWVQGPGRCWLQAQAFVDRQSLASLD